MDTSTKQYSEVCAIDKVKGSYTHFHEAALPLLDKQLGMDMRYWGRPTTDHITTFIEIADSALGLVLSHRGP